MENEANDFLATEKISKLMTKFAVPCVISLLIGAIYNITDQIFIGRGVGYLGNGATNVVFPLTVIALAIATMIGDGACTFISISLGRKDSESAHRTVGNAVILALVLSVILTLVYSLFQTQILHLFGATEGNMAYAKEYFSYIMLGIPFYMFGQAINPIMRSDGSPRYAMVATLAGAILNVILDPIAIFVLDWGMAGAALATVIGQILTAILSVAYLFKMKAVKLRRTSFVIKTEIICKFIPLGFCSLLSQGAMVISWAFTNNMLVKYGVLSEYGADIPLTVIGIVCKFLQIVISISIGMAAGCIPIVGFNFGAKRFDRTRDIMWKLLACETVLGLTAFIVIECFPTQLISLFGDEGDLYLQFAIKSFRIYLSMIPLACINKAAFIFMQSLGKPVLSTGLSFLREVVLNVPLVVILPVYFGVEGILYSMPVSDVIAFFASAIIIIHTNVQLKKSLTPEVRQPGVENELELSF